MGPPGYGKSLWLRLYEREFQASDGIFCPRIVLLPPAGGMDRRSSLIQQIESGVASAHQVFSRNKQRARRNMPSVSTKVTARVPMTPINFEVQTGGQADLELKAVRRFLDLLRARLHEGQPTLVMLDEADLLTPSIFGELLVPVLHWAGEEDLPLSIVLASVRPLPVDLTDGRSTIPPALTGVLRLRRVTEEESLSLLKDTAAAGGQDWSQVDLQPVVRACRGVPRLLQTAGRHLFQRGVAGWEHAVPVVAEGIASELRQLRYAIKGSEAVLFESLARLLEADPNAAEIELASELASAQERTSINDVVKHMNDWENRGMLERTDWGRLALLC